MVINNILSGFLVKAITGFDDTMVHIPVAGAVTKTRLGKVAFSLGILIAITVAIVISFLFASAIKLIPYYKYVSAGLIFFLAIAIYFNLIIQKPKEKVEKDLKKIKRISQKRFFKLMGIGFLTAIATVIDDTIAYSSLFLDSVSTAPYVILGIYIATSLELYGVIYFSKKIQKIPYKKEVTTIGLLVLGGLILAGVI